MGIRNWLSHKKEKSSAQQEDMTLVSFAKQGDKDAYRQLVEKYQKRAFAIAYSVTNSHEDAEDVVQESFVKAYLSLNNFKGESSFYTWFYRIVYNMAIDMRRRKVRRSQDVEYEDTGINGDVSVGKKPFASPSDALSFKEEASHVNVALAELSEEHRAVLLLRDIEGLSYDEIAEQLNIQRGTVMSRLFYARKYLQKKLVELGVEITVETKNDKDVNKIDTSYVKRDRQIRVGGL